MKKAKEWLNNIAQRGRARWGLWLSLALIFSLTAAPRLALAQEGEGWNLVNRLKDRIPLGLFGSIVTNGLNLFALLIESIDRLLITIIGFFLTEGEKIFFDQPALENAWRVALNLTNGLFLLGLIVAALGLILRAGAYNFKRVISGILLGAIFANFSLLLARFFISLAQALALNASRLLQAPGQNNIDSFKSGVYQILRSPAEGWWDVARGYVLFFWGPAGDLAKAFLSLVVAVVVLVAVAKIGIVLIERTVRLAILVILAPLIYPLALFPTTERYLKEWWENFIRWLLVLPLAYLILSFVGVLVASPPDSRDATGLAAQIKSVLDNPAGGTLPALIYSLVILALIWGAGEAASWLGAKAVIGDVFKKGAGYVAGFVGFAGGALTNLGGLVGGRGEALAKTAELAEGAGEIARAEKLKARAEAWKGAGKGFKVAGALPSALKKLYAGAGRRTEKWREEGEQEIFKGAEKVPGSEDIAMQARKEDSDKIVASIAEEYMDAGDLEKGLKEAAEKGDSRMLYVLSKAAGRRFARSTDEEEKKGILSAYQGFRDWLDGGVATAAEKQGKGESLSSEDKQALETERLIGSKRTGYVGIIQKNLNFGRPFPADLRLLTEQREAERERGDLYEDVAKLNAVARLDALEKKLMGLPLFGLPESLRQLSMEEIEQISSLTTILIKREDSQQTLIKSLRSAGLNEEEAQEIVKNPQVLAGLRDGASIEEIAEFNLTALGKRVVEKKVSEEQRQEIIRGGQEYSQASDNFSEQSEGLSDTGQEITKTLATNLTEQTNLRRELEVLDDRKGKGELSDADYQQQQADLNQELKTKITTQTNIQQAVENIAETKNEQERVRVASSELDIKTAPLRERFTEIARTIDLPTLERVIRDIEEGRIAADLNLKVSPDYLTLIARELGITAFNLRDAEKSYLTLLGKLLLLQEAAQKGKTPNP